MLNSRWERAKCQGTSSRLWAAGNPILLATLGILGSTQDTVVNASFTLINASIELGTTGTRYPHPIADLSIEIAARSMLCVERIERSRWLGPSIHSPTYYASHSEEKCMALDTINI